jgi:hypothetical protein
MVIFLSFLNPYRPHPDGGSEDIRRRIEAIAEAEIDVQVLAIDYAKELGVTHSIPGNVQLNLYSRRKDPRPWRWRYPFPCISRYSGAMIEDVRAVLRRSAKLRKVIFLERMQLAGLWADIREAIPQSAITILRVHNIESRYHASVALEYSGLLKAAHKLSSFQFLPLEKEFLPQFDRIYTLSSRETEYLRRTYGDISNALSLAYPIPKIADIGNAPSLGTLRWCSVILVT